MLLFLVASPAQAELVGEFNARLKEVKRSYGAYTVVADARVYDTTGVPPPPLASAVVHFPRGAALRRAFLAQRFLCDPAPLEVNPDPGLCRSGEFASGRIVLDARPHILEPFSADVHLFLGRGHEGAVASVVTLVIPNELTPAYAYQVLEGRLYNRSVAGRRFGYRLELPTRVKPLIPGLTLHLAEIHLTIRGLELRRRGRARRPSRSPAGGRGGPRRRCRARPRAPRGRRARRTVTCGHAWEWILRYPGAPGMRPSRWTLGRRMKRRQLTRRRREIRCSPSKA